MPVKHDRADIKMPFQNKWIQDEIHIVRLLKGSYFDQMKILFMSMVILYMNYHFKFCSVLTNHAFSLGVVAKWSKVLTAVPWPLMV